MAISSPQSTLKEVQGDLSRYVVRIGPADGTAPTRKHEAKYLQLLGYSRLAGGTRLDAGKLVYRLDITNQRLMDIASAVQFHRQIEIRRLDEDGKPTILETWGFLAIVEQSISRDGEPLSLEFRLDPFVFGGPLLGLPIAIDVPIFGVGNDIPPSETPEVVHWDWVFNPLIDRIIEGNRSDQHRERLESDPEAEEDDEETTATGPYMFVSPESMRTIAAREIGQKFDTRSKWKLSEAVHRLCWSCNPDEAYTTNPTLDELVDAFGENDEDVQNHACQYGDYLPKLLDDLLVKHGFGWYLTHEIEESEPTEEEEEEQGNDAPIETRITKLAFYRRGEGPKAQLLMQRPATSSTSPRFNFKKTNVDSMDHSVNLAELANVVIGRGSRKRFEGTLKLIPGWLNEYDLMDDPEFEPDPENPEEPVPQIARTIDTLSLTHEFGKAHPEVGRQFALNEAGDYCISQDDLGEVPPRPWKPYPLSDHLYHVDFDDGDVDFDEPLENQWAAVRRRFHPCISRHDSGDDKNSFGYYVEWWDRNVEGALTKYERDDPGWTKVKTGFRILEHQCGIYFDEPQAFLWQLVKEDYDYEVNAEKPSDEENPARIGLALRITASIDSDLCIEKTGDARFTSPQAEEIVLTLDLSNKFHFRQVTEGSIFHGQPGADAIDDSTKLQTYVDKVRDLEDAGDVSCSIVLPGADHAEWEIGKLVDKIDGRNITLTCNNPSADTPRALQIVGLNYQLGGEQKTELLLETFRKERPVL